MGKGINLVFRLPLLLGPNVVPKQTCMMNEQHLFVVCTLGKDLIIRHVSDVVFLTKSGIYYILYASAPDAKHAALCTSTPKYPYLL
jgi:hypothetical protein